MNFTGDEGSHDKDSSQQTIPVQVVLPNRSKMWRVAEFRALNESGINLHHGFYKKGGVICQEYPREMVFRNHTPYKYMIQRAFLDYCEGEGLGYLERSAETLYQTQLKIFSCYEWCRAKYDSFVLSFSFPY